MCLSYLLLFLLVLCFSIFLSIYTLVNKTNSNHFAGEILNANNCWNSPMDFESCVRINNALADNIDIQYWGQSDNRGLYSPSGVYSGSFGNPEVID